METDYASSRDTICLNLCYAYRVAHFFIQHTSAALSINENVGDLAGDIIHMQSP